MPSARLLCIDQIEKADTALAAVAAERLAGSDADRACVVTTDIDAGEGIVSALVNNEFKNGFELIEEIT